MVYKGNWDGSVYDENDVVIQDNCSMVANTTTSDPASPQPTGSETNIYTGDNTLPDSENTKQLITGMRYNTKQSGYITGFRINTVIGNTYRLYIVIDPLGSPIYREIISFTAKRDGWHVLNEQLLVQTNTLIDVVVLTNKPAATPTSTLTEYNYTIPNNLTAPLAGQITQSGKEPYLMLIHNTDDSAVPVDRTALLASLTAGDIIVAPNGVRWSIQDNTDNITYRTYQVAPASQNNITGHQEITFEQTLPTPISYREDLDFWLGNGNIRGIISLTGNYPTISITDSQYNVDVIVQPASISPDWDFLAFSGAGIVGGTAGGLVYDKEVSTGLVSGGSISATPTQTTYSVLIGEGRITDENGDYKTVMWDTENGIAVNSSETEIGRAHV